MAWNSFLAILRDATREHRTPLSVRECTNRAYLAPYGTVRPIFAVNRARFEAPVCIEPYGLHGQYIHHSKYKLVCVCIRLCTTLSNLHFRINISSRFCRTNPEPFKSIIRAVPRATYKKVRPHRAINAIDVRTPRTIVLIRNHSRSGA